LKSGGPSPQEIKVGVPMRPPVPPPMAKRCGR